MVQPLASFGNSRSQSNTNLSRSTSLSLFDRQGNEIPIQTTLDHPIQLLIPRDPNMILPPMTPQNVNTSNATPHNQLFNLHFSNITTVLPLSLHFEMHPLNRTVGYLFIYRFDASPVLNSTVNHIDGWTLFCPSSEFSFSFSLFILSFSILNRFDR